MPIHYELDDLRCRVVVAVHGPFQVDDILAIMARQRAEHTWNYGILYDLRGMASEPTVADLQQLLSEAIKLRQSDEPRDPVVLPASHSVFSPESDGYCLDCWRSIHEETR
jgi:hypothetical protein